MTTPVAPVTGFTNATALMKLLVDAVNAAFALDASGSITLVSAEALTPVIIEILADIPVYSLGFAELKSATAAQIESLDTTVGTEINIPNLKWQDIVEAVLSFGGPFVALIEAIQIVTPVPAPVVAAAKARLQLLKKAK